MAKVRTRFAPSPTGALHIGGLRTALYSFALAKHSAGDFILRIEDTDKKREVSGSKEKIIKMLPEFGLKWDEYYEQSQRVKEGLYQKAAEKLVAEGHAFYCQCQPRNAKPARNATQSVAGGKEEYSFILRDPCRDLGLKEGAIKLKVPDEEKVSFRDFVLEKEIAWETGSVADTTLLKSDGFPTYHLAVVVDDTEMKISHVLRGHDWLPSTPVHLLVYQFLGNPRPEIGHLTDILDPEGGKLSKRKGSASVEGLINEGYLPESILNFIMLLGWAPKDNRELFGLEEFVKAFEAQGFQKSNPVFNREKLDWFNGEYIRKLSDESLNLKFKIQNLKFAKLPEEKQISITKIIKERIKKLSEFDELAGFFFSEKKPDLKLFGPDYQKHLQAALEILTNIKDWNLETINADLLKAVNASGFKTGDFFMDLRIAICGAKFTPPINDSIFILEKETVLKRLSNYL